MMCKFIPFHGQNTTLSKFKNEKIISIFDVPPKNNKFKLTFLNPYNLYTEKYCIKFLEDIIKNIKGSNIKIIIKIKNINEDMSKKYFKYIDILEKKNKNNILIYRAGISAKSVIKVSDIVISLPFSSPSLIAKRMKIESFYYDPLNIVKLTEYNDRSVNMINTKKNLKKIIEDSKLLN